MGNFKGDFPFPRLGLETRERERVGVRDFSIPLVSVSCLLKRTISSETLELFSLNGIEHAIVRSCVT